MISPFNSWLWQMAWRDSRKSRQRLLLFISSIVLGIAALVAINSFSYNLEKSIENTDRVLKIARRNKILGVVVGSLAGILVGSFVGAVAF